MEVSKSEINETFKVFSALLEERKAELMRELDGMYTAKQVAMSVHSQKAQEVVDKIFQVRNWLREIIICPFQGSKLNQFISRIRLPFT